MNSLMKRKYGLELESIVFPKNQVECKDVLQNYSNITTYRSPDEYWYSRMPLKFVLSKIDDLLPISPVLNELRVDEYGLNHTSGSLLFRRRSTGWTSVLPISILRVKAVKGLRKSVETGSIFHLWFHPFNFSFKQEQHFSALEAVLQEAVKWRSLNKLEIVVMKDLVSDG